MNKTLTLCTIGRCFLTNYKEDNQYVMIAPDFRCGWFCQNIREMHGGSVCQVAMSHDGYRGTLSAAGADKDG